MILFVILACAILFTSVNSVARVQRRLNQIHHD